jgi:hypothetical protein
MKAKDMGVVAAVAVVTAALVMVLNGVMPSAIAVQAGRKGPAPGTLTVDGVILTVEVDAASFKPGQKPVVRVKAVNTRDVPVVARADLSMQSLSLASRMSRMPVMPQSIWDEGCQMSLEANETKTFELATNVPVPKGVAITVTMKAGGKTVAAPGTGILALAGRANLRALSANGAARRVNISASRLRAKRG